MTANLTEWLLERQLLPDFLIRAGIRFRLKKTLAKESAGGKSAIDKRKKELIRVLRGCPIAVNTREANEQHYELPTEFYQLALGRRLKYSGGYWPAGVTDLNASEEAMLALTVERAEIKSGQKILELGCGWGSLTLYMAEKFPESRITGVSNSRTQKIFIDQEARRRGLKNVTIITADMNDFDIQDLFDRVVSVEMFEHMRNYQKLFEKIARWLTPDGKLFVHIFSHKAYAYLYDESDPNDFIGRYFFTGGIMPSHDLLLQFQHPLRIENQWVVPGGHYEKTSNAWLEAMDRNKPMITPLFEKTYGAQSRKWWAYWRVFFLACAELFGYRAGSEWQVSHYLFSKS